MSNQMNRREFLRVGGALAAGTALAGTGCKPPQEATVPFHDMPETMAAGLGKSRYYTTVLEGAPVLVRTREGRPILVVPNPDDPTVRGLTVRDQAALMDLYDPDRATGPVSLRRGRGAPVPTSWDAVGAEVVARLRQSGKPVALVTGPVASPALSAAIAELASSVGLRHVEYSPIECDAAAAAWLSAFGTVAPPRPRLDRADLIVGFGAEFVDRPRDGLERDFAQRRAPRSCDCGTGAPGSWGMNRFVQFEGRLSLTGANADQRVRVRDSQLADVAAAVAHQIVVVHRVGPLAGQSAVTRALSPYTAEAVAAATGVEAAFITELAEQILEAGDRAIALAGGAASTAASGLALETAVILINESLSGHGTPVFDQQARQPLAHGGARALAELAADMRAGQVGALLLAGPNPVYDGPAGLDFAAAMGGVDLVVSLNSRTDETSALADYLAPASHALECWGDAALPGGVCAVQQPAIQPLYDTHGLLDILVAWGAAAGVGGDIAAAAALSRPPADAAADAPVTNPSGAYHYLRAQWAARLQQGDVGSAPFEQAWNGVLSAGFFQGVERFAAPRPFAGAAVACLGTPPAPAAGLELQTYPGFALDGGASANNGWLQEFPDPVTRISWGNALSMAPRRFDEMGLANGDLVEVAVNGARLTLPAYRHAGMHHDQLAVALGYGRTACGAIGADIGDNAFGLRALADGGAIGAGLAATVQVAGGKRELALAQGSDVIDRDRRPLVPATTLAAYAEDPKSGTEQPPGGPSAWDEHEYDGPRWAMAIDLSKCNGCGKCTIACQAENNIPVVGGQGIIDGREMSWMRIDRYYDAPRKDGRWDAEVWDGPLEVVEEPQTLFEPMLCQHCENAPCETVCPFVATMHSDDGLNQQIYNRCVGTRYCANNCPFKVRRYNWYEYSHPRESWFFNLVVPELKRHAELNTRGRMQMKNNPEVTVRTRGVMEKCSFCIQRIREARAEATRDGRDKEKLPDGTVVPACMEVCPTGAIVFGDINDPDSEVSALARSPRAMKLLEMTGVKPSISYLTKVRNDHV